MKNLNRIDELRNEVKNASTRIIEGRQVVANSCRELYDILEDSLYEAYGEEAVIDAYSDLIKSNFCELYHCEMNKDIFTLYADIYTNIFKKFGKQEKIAVSLNDLKELMIVNVYTGLTNLKESKKLFGTKLLGYYIYSVSFFANEKGLNVYCREPKVGFDKNNNKMVAYSKDFRIGTITF